MSADDVLIERILTHFESEGFDDIFRPPFFGAPPESYIVADADMRNKLAKEARQFLNKPSSRGFATLEKFAIPKNPYAYRQAALIRVEDLVKFSSLIFGIGPQIEAARLPRAKRCVFSYRFNKTGALFSESYGFKEFRKESAKRSKQKKFSVKIATDIANFFDRINIHRVESALAEIGVANDKLKAINDILLHWAGRNSYGIPVGCDASRMLAEASLIQVDNYLVQRGINFVRYVDDYRIFAPSFPDAHSALHILIDRLDREGLFLNTSKTVFFDLDAAEEAEDQPFEMKPFEKIDEEEKKESLKAVKVGYVTKIVKYYRKPGEEKIKKLKIVDLEALIEKIWGLPFEQAEEDIKLFIQAFIYQGASRSDLLEKLVGRFVHTITYCVDALIAEKDRVSDKDAEQIIGLFERYFEKHNVPPYYQLMLVRLFAHSRFFNPLFLEKFVHELGAAQGQVFLREVFLRISAVADRNLLNTIRDMSSSFDVPVRRAFFFVYRDSSTPLAAEKRAWMKQRHHAEADPYLAALAGKALSSA